MRHERKYIFYENCLSKHSLAKLTSENIKFHSTPENNFALRVNAIDVRSELRSFYFRLMTPIAFMSFCVYKLFAWIDYGNFILNEEREIAIKRKYTVCWPFRIVRYTLLSLAQIDIIFSLFYVNEFFFWSWQISIKHLQLSFFPSFTFIWISGCYLWYCTWM